VNIVEIPDRQAEQVEVLGLVVVLDCAIRADQLRA